jgi:5-methylcytosine-specific restriction endonuclease McrA
MVSHTMCVTECAQGAPERESAVCQAPWHSPASSSSPPDVRYAQLAITHSCPRCNSVYTSAVVLYIALHFLVHAGMICLK